MDWVNVHQASTAVHIGQGYHLHYRRPKHGHPERGFFRKSQRSFSTIETLQLLKTLQPT